MPRLQLLQRTVRDLQKLRLFPVKKFYAKHKPYLSKNGSLLPNKYALWDSSIPARFQYYSDKDF